MGFVFPLLGLVMTAITKLFWLGFRGRMKGTDEDFPEEGRLVRVALFLHLFHVCVCAEAHRGHWAPVEVRLLPYFTVVLGPNSIAGPGGRHLYSPGHLTGL